MSSCGMGRCFTSDGVREYGSREYCMAQAMRDASDTDSSRSTASIYDRTERGGGNSNDAQAQNLPLNSSSFSRCYIADKKLSVDLPPNVIAIQLTALAKLSQTIGALQQPLSGLQQSVSTSQRTVAHLSQGIDALRENLAKMQAATHAKIQQGTESETLHFPSKAEIISCLENYPLTNNTTSSDSIGRGMLSQVVNQAKTKIIEEMSANLAGHNKSMEEVSSFVETRLFDMKGQLGLSNATRKIIGVNLVKALKACANATTQ